MKWDWTKNKEKIVLAQKLKVEVAVAKRLVFQPI